MVDEKAPRGYGSSPEQKMFRGWTEATLFRPRTVPVGLPVLLQSLDSALVIKSSRVVNFVVTKDSIWDMPITVLLWNEELQGKLFFYMAFVWLHRWVCTYVRHFHLLSKQWSCELGLGLGFSLRAARVHTHNIYIHATCERHVEKGLTLLWRATGVLISCKTLFSVNIHGKHGWRYTIFRENTVHAHGK